MPIEETRVELGQLRAGMFVCRLDRDWTETPFPLQGFLIEDEQDIEQLRRYCNHVYIDVEQGIDADDALLTNFGGPLSRPPVEQVPQARVVYETASTVLEEIPRAADAIGHVSERAVAIIQALRKGNPISHAEVRAAVEPVVASLVRNPDAFFWLQALRKHGDYAYGHAVDCCALAAALGRQLGLPEPTLEELATGGILLDIGMTAVPAEILARPGPLSGEAREQVRKHVELGLAMYRESGMDNAIAIQMLSFHHERHDGSGYPDGLSGNDIPLCARIAGIVDSYDAMISPRPHRAAMSRHEALQNLYRDRDRLYQGELIEQFVQCLGVYPVGSLVELSSGEIAIVVAQNPTRRLRPALMLLTDEEKRVRDHFEPLDLMLADRASVPQSGLSIVRGLQPGAHGLEPSELYL